MRSVDRSLTAGSIYHSGFVVGSITHAIERWATIAGAGPFVCFGDFRFSNPTYRGVAVGPIVSLAFGFSGSTCIELIEPLDTAPSIYRELPSGLHHVGIAVDNLESALSPYRDAGITCAFQGGFAFGGGCAYLDTRARLGCFTELVERNAAIDSILAKLRVLHINWDRRQLTAELP